MKLTFAASLALLSVANASSDRSGGLRNRRLNLFGDSDKVKNELKAKVNNANSSPKNSDAAAATTTSNTNTNNGKKNSANEKQKAKAKNDAQFLKAEAQREDSGIITTKEEYLFGETIEGAFSLTDEFVTDAVKDYLDIANVGEFKMALYPKMGRPQCGQSAPITAVDSVITPAEGGDESTLNYVGTFSMPTDKQFRSYGLGFDLFLIDENGCQVTNPKEVTLTLSKQEEEAEIAAAQEKAEKKDTALKKFQAKATSVVHKSTYKKEKASKTMDIEKMNTSTKPALSEADYELYTDKHEYQDGENIIVTYSIATAVAEGRRLNEKANNGKVKVEPEEPITEEEMPTQPDPINNDTEFEQEEEVEQQPDLVPDMAIEEETEVDANDITHFKIGFFMKMSHPQGGKLEPIISVPLCKEGDICTAADISSGSITVSSTELKPHKHGNGYDAWVLDATGDGVAGPVTFVLTL